MKKRTSGSTEASGEHSPSQLIDARTDELGDWRGETLARVRTLVKQAVPEVVEEWKWRGVPVWYHGGMICTGESYKNVVKLTFAKGASLEDPSGLFNSSLDGNTRRGALNPSTQRCLQGICRRLKVEGLPWPGVQLGGDRVELRLRELR